MKRASMQRALPIVEFVEARKYIIERVLTRAERLPRPLAWTVIVGLLTRLLVNGNLLQRLGSSTTPDCSAVWRLVRSPIFIVRRPREVE